MAQGFMLATGIENSSPVVDGERVDEMESCGHYERWRGDFDLVTEMGIRFLRYGPPLYRTWIAADRYDWEFADRAFAELHRLNIGPIADLCHFGLPDWLGNLNEREERVTTLPADQGAVERHILSLSRAAREGAAA